MTKFQITKNKFLEILKMAYGWVTKNSAIMFTVFLSVLFITLVSIGINTAIKGNYDGTTVPWQGMDPKDPTKTLTATLDKIPAGYIATFILSIIGGAFSIFALGGWLRGSSWINKSNTYKKGTLYVRTKAQNIVFRIITILIAFAMLSSFFLTIFYEDLNDMINKTSSFVGNKNFSSSSVFQATLDYLLTPSHWYYQCFLSSLFMGVALTFKKYKWVQYLLPLAFIGVFRTFIDVSDWADDASWTNMHFLRLTFVHVMIVAGPIFVMVSNRYRYSLKDIKVSAIYTFLMAFGAYMIFFVKHQSNLLNHDTTALDQGTGFYDKAFGELTGVGDILHISDAWIHANPHMFFWLVVVPFGVLIFAIFIFIYNFFYFKSQAKGNFFKRWVSVWKPWFQETIGMQWTELKNSMHFFNKVDRPAKVKKTIFGLKPAKGKISEDPYVKATK